jgi:hypothetical protein
MDQQYTRKLNVIKDMAGNVVFTGSVGSGDLTMPSINAAKRESRRLQGAALGRGLVSVL